MRTHRAVERIVLSLLISCWMGNFTLVWATPQVPVQGTPLLEAHLLEAKRLTEKRKWDEAIMLYRSLRRTEPGSTAVLAGLSTALFYSGDRSQALEVLKQGLPLVRPLYRSALKERIDTVSRQFLTQRNFKGYQEGVNFLRAKRYRNAKESFEKALGEEPDNIEVLIRIAQCALFEGEPDEALKSLQAAKKLNPFSFDVKLWLGRALQLSGNPQVASKELQEAHQDNPESEWATIWLAEAWFAMGQVKHALQVLEADVDEKPLHIQSLLASARMRTQVKAPSSDMLWVGRKNLQLALSRMDSYFSDKTSSGSSLSEGDMWLDQRKSPQEFTAEAQRLLQIIQNKQNEISPVR